MKNLLNTGLVLLICGMAVVACKSDDSGDIKEVSAIAVDSVVVPSDTMTVNTLQAIKTYSQYQSGCEGFYGYDYRYDDFSRIVTAYKFKTGDPCLSTYRTYVSTINFVPQQTGTYTFKFWKGADSSGNSQWIEKSVVVK
ncbi:hypothetical protein [Daejeonia sp. YH14]|uniref:hypothetical protein n=1 Tax=Daejeonia sp. YH14 TaxID=3439042 RepID=UPI003F49B1CA